MWLKSNRDAGADRDDRVSVLNREPMWLKCAQLVVAGYVRFEVSVLNREPMWLKWYAVYKYGVWTILVSVLNREPMWLKFNIPAEAVVSEELFQCSTVSRCG